MVRRLRMVCSWVCASVVLAGAGPALGQPSGDSAATREGHGWLGVASLEGGGGTLLHLPPRADAGAGGVRAGAARPARELAQVPSAVTGWDREVFLLYRGAGDRVEVYSLRAAEVGISGAWVTEPLDGAIAEPVLGMEGAGFAGAAGSAAGLVVLGRDGAGEAGPAGPWRLWLLGDAGWSAVAVPEGLAGAAAARLVAGSARPTLVVDSGAGLARWVLGGEGEERWQAEGLGGLAPSDWGTVLGVFTVGGDVCLAERSGGGVLVRSVGPGLVGQLARMELGGEPVGVTPVAGGRRLVALAVVRDAGASGLAEPAARWELVELSLVSGRELYRGALRHPALEIASEVRWLSLAMMGMTVCVLFYLLRPSGEGGEVRLPAGVALAPPGRRVAGGMIDAALVAGLVQVVLGVPIADMVLVLPMLDTPGGLLALTAWAVGGAVYGTMAEWLFGRTLGKLLVGTRVVSVDPKRDRVGLMRSGARNVFRWVLMPWALFGLGSPGLRHRGDVLAGAAVVVAAEVEEGDGGDEGVDG